MSRLVETGNGFSQCGQTQCPGVRKGRLRGDALQLAQDGRRCAEIGLTQIELDDTMASGLQCGGVLAELHRQERRDRLCALGEVHGSECATALLSRRGWCGAQLTRLRPCLWPNCGVWRTARYMCWSVTPMPLRNSSRNCRTESM